MEHAEILAALPEKIATRLVVHPESGCLLWVGATNRDGYGIVRHEGKCRLVHRVVPELLGQPLPPQTVWGHLTPEVGGPCLHRNCCHLDHGRPVPVDVNSRELVPWNRKKTHCPQGHAYAEHGKSYQCKDGRTRRFCTACKKGGDNKPNA